MRLGLSTKFWLLVLASLLVCFLLGLLAWRQQAIGIERLAHLSGQTIHEASVQNEQRRALGMAQLMADALVNPLYYLDLVAIGEVAQSALGQPEVAYVLIYDGDGRIVHDGSAGIVRFGQRMGDALAAEAIKIRQPLAQVTESIIDANVPVWLGQERIGGVRVGIALTAPAKYEHDAMASLQANGDELRRYLRSISLGMAGMLIVMATFGGWLVSRRVVRPIQRLAEAARRIEAGDYESEARVSGRSDEIGELQSAFARMGESVRRHDRDIRRLAYDDSLTGLPNRIAFRKILETRIDEAHASGGQVALLFIDLDEFKRINDTLGHDVGDEAIAEFGARIRRVTGGVIDDRVDLARFGGDEFVVALSGRGVRERAAYLGKALLAELRQPVLLDEYPVMLAASIGISLYPQDASESTSLLKNADIAMYRAKLDGKNCLRFYARNMEQAVVEQMQLDQDLRLALERNELTVVYQPIHAVADRRIIGAEALLRWNHPQRGLIEPERFIAVAEESGQIDAIGRFVLHTACRDALEWPDTREPGFISVNVSTWQLQRSDLPSVVEGILKSTGLVATRLHLEFTETAVMANEVAAISAATRLRHMGVKIWLDDFGTGFSGLSQLRRVPVDGVKIDRSFIADMLEDAGDMALTSAVIAMAHSLGIVVTAEGVETDGQYEALKARGCDNAQGFWLTRPLRLPDLLELLQARSV